MTHADMLLGPVDLGALEADVQAKVAAAKAAREVWEASTTLDGGYAEFSRAYAEAVAARIKLRRHREQAGARP